MNLLTDVTQPSMLTNIYRVTKDYILGQTQKRRDTLQRAPTKPREAVGFPKNNGKIRRGGSRAAPTFAIIFRLAGGTQILNCVTSVNKFFVKSSTV